MRATCACLCLLTLLLLPPAAVTAQRAQGLAQHVIVISIDGLRPDHYLPLPTRQAKMPALDALRARGSWADGVVGQFPSLTYPSHGVTRNRGAASETRGRAEHSVRSSRDRGHVVLGMPRARPPSRGCSASSCRRRRGR
ncbi:MAG: alkaline phosphatase family protein [Vicinamibacterales bacterium]